MEQGLSVRRTEALVRQVNSSPGLFVSITCVLRRSIGLLNGDAEQKLQSNDLAVRSSVNAILQVIEESRFACSRLEGLKPSDGTTQDQSVNIVCACMQHGLACHHGFVALQAPTFVSVDRLQVDGVSHDVVLASNAIAYSRPMTHSLSSSPAPALTSQHVPCHASHVQGFATAVALDQ